MIGVRPNEPTTEWRCPTIMRALEPEVVDAVWAAVEPYLPGPSRTQPLGCHRSRTSDRLVLGLMLVRLVTRSSWVTTERLCANTVSATTARARRDEWVEAGVFDKIAEEAICADDKIIGLDLEEVAVDDSMHKAPGGGEGTGLNPTDRGRTGWKWSIATDFGGIPVGWATDGANRHDQKLLGATLDAVARRGLLWDVGTLHLDRGDDADTVRTSLVTTYKLDDVVIARKRPAGSAKVKRPVPLGLRWPVERTNAWLANFGQLRRNTDRKTNHRLAQFALALVALIAAELIDLRDRWCPASRLSAQALRLL